MKLGVLVALVASIAWGYVFTVKDSLTKAMSPLSLMAAFYLAGAVLFLPVAYINRADLTQGLSSHAGEFLTALAVIILAETCIVWSVSLLGGSEAALIEVSYPIWTILLLYLFKDKVPATSTLVGGAFIMAGIGILSLSGKGE